jgi:cytosine/uracil/thiamine/allantoin permease
LIPAPDPSLHNEDLLHGVYSYKDGINMRAVLALGTGIVVALTGLFAPPLRPLHDYSWFVGFGVSAAAYVALMRRAPAPAAELEWEAEA